MTHTETITAVPAKYAIAAGSNPDMVFVTYEMGGKSMIEVADGYPQFQVRSKVNARARPRLVDSISQGRIRLGG